MLRLIRFEGSDGLLKQLFRYVGVYKKESIRAIVTVLFEIGLEMSIPLLMAMVIDRGVATQDRGNIFLFGGLMILAAMTALILGTRSGRDSALASAGFAKNLRQVMFHQAQDFSHENMDEFSRSSLVSRMTTDVTNVQMMYQVAFLRVLVRSPLMVLVSFMIVLTMNPWLAFIFLFAVPPLGLIMFVFITKAHDIYKKIFKHYDHLNNVVSENLSAIRVVKANGTAGSEVKKFTKITEDLYTDFVKAESLLALNMPIAQATIYACILVISFLGARSVVSGEMLTGELMSILTYTFQMLMGVMLLSFGVTLYVSARPAIARILEVIHADVTLVSKENAVTTVKDGSLVFDQVYFKYHQDEKFVLEGINLSIPHGAKVGMIGASGASKTTLVSLLSRLYDVTEGSVQIGGVDVREYELKALRRAVSVVLQKNVLFSGSIRDNLLFGNVHATDEALIRVCEVAGAMEFIEQLPAGFETRIDELGTNLSGGQKQRLCIARALLARPKVLVLDDSTSAVDVKTESDIFAGFDQFNSDATVIVISARVSSIKDMDMIIVVDDHHIDGVGTHDELLACSTIYRQIYEMQQEMEVDVAHEE
ncbi:MAG: ABC transporter ATP-binding protein/permease [Defluviitaleaceae bacterium]|nr:ABC transporter ATP-binding protein/permease [Defluviitaleaceae bacterium]